MSIARILVLALTLPLATAVHATVYKCVDSSGRTTYTNDRTLTRDCTPLNTDLPVSSIPAPAPSATPAPRAPGAAATDFPRVSPDAQRDRDDSRKQILTSELAAEEAALRKAREKLEAEEERDAPEDRNIVRQRADGGTYRSINEAKKQERLQPYRDQVELHERNIEALKREISGLR